jgi:glycosyltransferase involved in cell wall biosynthesis
MSRLSPGIRDSFLHHFLLQHYAGRTCRPDENPIERMMPSPENDLFPRAGEARRKRALPGKKVIGMVARLDYETKDHRTLLKAFSLLCRNRGDVELWLVGEGSDRCHLAQEAAELGISQNIVFWGARQDVPELLGQMDIFAFSTTNEGFPIAIMEALAAGLPVVATSAGACVELLDEGKAGILVPRGDPRALAESLELLLCSEEARQAYKEKALDRARDFTIERCAAEWHEALFGPRST